MTVRRVQRRAEGERTAGRRDGQAPGLPPSSQFLALLLISL